MRSINKKEKTSEEWFQELFYLNFDIAPSLVLTWAEMKRLSNVKKKKTKKKNFYELWTQTIFF